jgi:hypothetical protein
VVVGGVVEAGAAAELRALLVLTPRLLPRLAGVAAARALRRRRLLRTSATLELR